MPHLEFWLYNHLVLFVDLRPSRFVARDISPGWLFWWRRGNEGVSIGSEF